MEVRGRVMTEVERIVDQYDRAMNGDAWHGDPVWKILEGISGEDAAVRVHRNTHSIWELVSHMTFWETEVYGRLKNLPARSQEQLNFPPPVEAVSTEQWGSAIAEFRESNARFRQALTELSLEQLDHPTKTSKRSVYVEVHGVIQHNLYHAGQIAFLRKFLC
jgi:uncharacterized damage-inducible protein DinB